jgi:GT2 family glycosyltransferase
MEEGQPPTAREPLVSVIIVSYNVKDLLLDCLAALYQRTDIPLEAIVVDNVSKDGSAEAVEAEFPQAKVHRMRKNVGFGRAANAGLEHAGGRFIMVLNPGVMVSEGCVGELADFLLVRPDAGAVGPRIVGPDGHLDPGARRAFPTPSVAFYRVSGLSRAFPHSPRFGRHNMGHLSAERTHEIDAGTAACLMIRRAAIAKVGFFDPAYFMYGEDIDLCYRLKQGGWKIFYVPTAEALHIRGASSRQEASKALYQYHSALWTFHHKHFADELPAFGNGLFWAAIWGHWAALAGWSAVERVAKARPVAPGGTEATPLAPPGPEA